MRGEEAAALFAEDGIWYRDGDEAGFTGRAEIAAHVNKLPERGNPNVPQADRMVFHLVTNVEVTVIDAQTAEVRALTSVVPGARGKNGAGRNHAGHRGRIPDRRDSQEKPPTGGRSPARRRSRRFVSVRRLVVAAAAALFLCALMPREAPAQADAAEDRPDHVVQRPGCRARPFGERLDRRVAR